MIEIREIQGKLWKFEDGRAAELNRAETESFKSRQTARENSGKDQQESSEKIRFSETPGGSNRT